MNFGFTEEQDLLRAEVRKFLDQNCPLEEVRKIAETEEGYSQSYFRRAAELGWVGLTLPAKYGGMGLSWFDLVVVLEETGRSLFPSPIIPTVLAGTAIAIAGTEEQQKRWLPGISEGTKIGTLAFLEENDRLDVAGVTLVGKRDGDAWVLTGEKHFVLDATNADVFVVAFRTGAGAENVSLALVERDTAGVDVTAWPSIDTTKRQGVVRFDGVGVGADSLLGEPGNAAPLFANLIDRGAVATTAEIIGAAEAALHLATEYAKERVQFGQPIGRFQGIKHPLAEMFVDVESFKSLLYYAAWALDEDPGEAPVATSRAKAYASEAFARIGIEVVQIHGGVGYTWEYDAQLYLKRAKWSRPVFGASDYHYNRVAELGGL